MLNRKIKLVIFDLDGTLMDAYRAVEMSLKHVLKDFGLKPIDAQTIRRTVGWGDRHLVEALVGPELSGRAVKLYRAHHKGALLRGSRLLPGAKKLLQTLRKRKYKLAVASNRPDYFSRLVMRHLGISRFFHYVLCGDKAPRPKPYPDMLKQILLKFGCKPDEALYVGDMVIDVDTGKSAGVKTVVIPTGSSSLEELKAKSPFRVLRRVDEVLDILDELD